MSSATDARTGPSVPAPPVADPFGSARVRLAAFSAAAVLAAVLPRWIALPPIPMCTFKAWTGLPCPGCGMTRSVFRLALSDVGASFRFHPLGPLLGLLLVALTLGALAGVVSGRDPVWDFCRRRATPLALGFVALLLVTWVVRTFVVPDWSPDPIAPPAWAGE